ncbi:MAG: hypothetical protein IPM24_21650 [Bryobacterales bacterium]|nr:hypothetical protein [Bryobacterales bacterium]
MSLLRYLTAVLALAAASPAAVVRVEIAERSDVLAGKAFGKTGAYERLTGRVFFEVDPGNEANRLISDIDLAPRNSHGKVEFSADLYVLAPKDLSKGNRTVFYEVSNRGRKGLLDKYNLGAGSFDPREAEHFGDGFLMERGYTLVWMGWQQDVPPEKDLLRFYVPIATRDGLSVTGVVRSDFVPDTLIRSFHLADRTHIPYRAIENAPRSMTVRDCAQCPRQQIPRDQWQLARDGGSGPVPDTAHVYMASGFQPGKIYEVVYQALDPKLVGLGLAATRDLMSFLKYGAPGTTEMPLGNAHRDIRHTIGFGSSQSGRFLRTFLYFGMNRDEQGRMAFDGLWPSVAGGGRGSFNHRFAQPSRDARPHFNFLYPTDIFPFTDLAQKDPETGLEEGILARPMQQKSVPKVFYTNSSYEYYGRSASLIHQNVDGSRDFGPGPETRVYLVAGTNHGPGSFPPRQGKQQNMANTNDYRWAFRALLDAMQAWVAEGKEPPPSQHPRIDKDQLVPLPAVQFPKIPGVAFPTHIQTAFRADYGPEFRSKGVVAIEPPHLGKPFPMKVPQVDRDGNETSGIRLPVITVPLGTNTGWNLRAPEIGAPNELFSMTGSWLPFPKTKAERERTGDPRLSIAERYRNREDFLRQVRQAAADLAAQRYVLEGDIPRIVEQSAAQWDYYMSGQ